MLTPKCQPCTGNDIHFRLLNRRNWNNGNFMRWKIAHVMVGLEPTTYCLHADCSSRWVTGFPYDLWNWLWYYRYFVWKLSMWHLIDGCHSNSQRAQWREFSHVFRWQLAMVTSSGIGTGILWDSKANAMAVDALAPCIARVSATMVLNVKGKKVLVFHEEEFQLPPSSYFWGMWIQFYVFQQQFDTTAVNVSFNRPLLLTWMNLNAA